MSKRIILNETSYFGKGAIKEIINELQSRHFQKILVTTGEDLLEFGVATKVTDLLRDAGINFEVYTDIKPNPTIENIKNGVIYPQKEKTPGLSKFVIKSMLMGYMTDKGKEHIISI